MAIFFLVPVAWAPRLRIFSSIFSHTRGTPRKMVGRTSFSVAGSEPLRASGCANHVVPARAMGAWMSTICAAMWLQLGEGGGKDGGREQWGEQG